MLFVGFLANEEVGVFANCVLVCVCVFVRACVCVCVSGTRKSLNIISLITSTPAVSFAMLHTTSQILLVCRDAHLSSRMP